MSINWDDFKRPEAGDYPNRWKPENIGDQINGKITVVRIATMPDGTQYPSLTVDTDNGLAEVLCSQTLLLKQMVAKQPKVGDNITIKHTAVEKLAGGKTLKHFEVVIGASPAPSAGNIL